MKRGRLVGIQYAALPYRLTGRQLSILLVSSRGTRRWVIPKGWPMPGLTPAEAAATEAYEEAGIRGLMREAVGVYPYHKRLKDETTRELLVEVFPMQVEAELSFWPEATQRRRRWFEPANAAKAIGEPELAEIILGFAP